MNYSENIRELSDGPVSSVLASATYCAVSSCLGLKGKAAIVRRGSGLSESHLSRRALLALTGTSILGGVAGCSIANGDDPETTSTPEPTETPKVEPTPTQPPIASPVPGYADAERWTGRTLVVAAWGGTYQAAQNEAFFSAFSSATGANVQEKVADLPTLRSQVENEDVVWDVLTVPMEEMLRLANDGVIRELDYDVIDRSLLYDDIVFDHGVGAAYFSSTMIYPDEATNAPSTWGDFWDVTPPDPDLETDPADLRCLRRSPIGTLEFALLADEVPVEDLYPLDIERAYTSLDRVRDNVIVWWQESKEPIELVAARQIGMASAWNARVEELELGTNVRTLWYQGMLSADAWVVPTGAANDDVAMDFINFATRAIPSANFSRLVPYGPVNVEAFQYLSRDRLPFLPSAPQNKPVQFVQDWAFWASNEEELTAQFEEWILEPEEDGTPEVS